MNSKRIDYAVPGLVVILYFLTVRLLVPSAVCIVAAIAAGLYYVPFRLAVQLRAPGELKPLRKTEIIYTNLNFFIILVLSVLRLLLGADRTLKNIISIVGIFTYIGMFYFFSTEKKGNSGILYFIFSCLVSSLVFVD